MDCVACELERRHIQDLDCSADIQELEDLHARFR